MPASIIVLILKETSPAEDLAQMMVAGGDDIPCPSPIVATVVPVFDAADIATTDA